MQINIISCSFVTLEDGANVTFHGRCFDENGRSNEGEFSANGFGLAKFKNQQDGSCCLYNKSPGVSISFAKFINFLGLILGYVALTWLFFSSVWLPLSHYSKMLLVRIIILVAVSSSMSFLLYTSDYCRDYGCAISVGACLAAASVISFVLTSAAVMDIELEIRPKSSLTKKRSSSSNMSEGDLESPSIMSVTSEKVASTCGELTPTPPMNERKSISKLTKANKNGVIDGEEESASDTSTSNIQPKKRVSFSELENKSLNYAFRSSSCDDCDNDSADGSISLSPTHET